jgi:hypothetical protein
MINLDDARRLVASLMLDPGDEIDDLQLDGTAALVHSGTWTWRVEPAAVNLTNTAVKIWDVSLDVMSDPGQRPVGFALYEGRIYRLSEKPGLDEFWRHAGPLLGCLDLVALLVRYHSGGSSEHLMKTDDALADVVGPSAANTIEGVSAPRCTTDEDGALDAVDFHTWRLHPDMTVSLHRWHVLVGEGEVAWDVTAIAGELTWRVGE